MADGNGGNAFPAGLLRTGGVSLRDYFAARALQGFAADSNSHDLFDSVDKMAQSAYAAADAMLRQRQAA